MRIGSRAEKAYCFQAANHCLRLTARMNGNDSGERFPSIGQQHFLAVANGLTILEKR
jgi:hypothetical protein